MLDVGAMRTCLLLSWLCNAGVSAPAQRDTACYVMELRQQQQRQQEQENGSDSGDAGSSDSPDLVRCSPMVGGGVQLDFTDLLVLQREWRSIWPQLRKRKPRWWSRTVITRASVRLQLSARSGEDGTSIQLQQVRAWLTQADPPVARAAGETARTGLVDLLADRGGVLQDVVIEVSVSSGPLLQRLTTINPTTPGACVVTSANAINDYYGCADRLAAPL
jgi:hypothetical protein